jgi:hypothetical protein
MKKNIILSVLAIMASLSSFAQCMEQGTIPVPAAKEKEFSEWKKVEGTVNGEKITYEYRIAFNKRKALACYYEIQLKNTSEKALKIKIKTHYRDKLVKNNFGDEFKETVKPGKDQGFLVVTQGCKADKDKKDQPDIERCLGCDFSYEIYAEFK